MGSWQINMRLLFKSGEQCEAGINKPCSFLIYFHQWRILNKMNTRVFRSEFGVHYLSLNYEIHITTACFFTKNPEIASDSIRVSKRRSVILFFPQWYVHGNGSVLTCMWVRSKIWGHTRWDSLETGLGSGM